MIRYVMPMLILVGLCSPAVAQLDAYNPYAKPVEEPAVREDGTLNWPPFFKSAKLENRFQMYFEMGSCRGTRQAINQKLKDNTVNVNTLPNATVTGRIAKLLPGAIGVIDADGHTAFVVTHPQGVSQISIDGDVPADAIRPGLTLRFLGQVDEQGHGVEPIGKFEIGTLSRELRPTEVTPGRTQTIVGVVAKRKGNLLRVNTNVGTLKSLTFMMAPDAQATVHGSGLDLLSLGDDVTAKGHSYAGKESVVDKTIFAEELTVTKHLLVSSP